MKGRRVWRWVVCGLLILVLASGLAQAGVRQKLEISHGNTQIQVYQPLDLVMHIFAHLEMEGSPASLYDPEYIQWIAQQKRALGGEDLVTELAEFQRQLERDANLYRLNFYPVYFNSTEHMLDGLKYVESGSKLSSYIFLSPQEKYLARYIRDGFNQRQRQAVGDFAQVAVAEYEEFYKRYWAGQATRYQEGMAWFKDIWVANEPQVIEEFFAHYGKTKIRVYLSEGLRKNGRGFGSSEPELVQGAAKMPENRKEAYRGYMIALHEMIHQVTDPLVYEHFDYDPNQKSVDPSNQKGIQIHNAVEKSVVYAQYWLMREISPEMEERYLEFAAQMSPAQVRNLAELEEMVQLPEELRAALRQAVESALD